MPPTGNAYISGATGEGMYSRTHGLLSVLVGVLVVVLAPAPVEYPFLVVAYATALGVGIDLDHFLVARVNRGDWVNARRCLRDPRLAVADQAAIFDAGDLWRDQRLLSHCVLGGLATAGLWVVDPFWAGLTALTVYVHVVADLISDVRTRERYFDGVVAHRRDR